jgi:putative flippase GtrA
MIVVSRFGLVGLIATVIHIVVVWRLIDMTPLPVLVANLVAFLTAFGVSFAGNYYWTFRNPGRPGRTMRRFFLVSASAFGANTILLGVILNKGWLTPTVSAITAAAVIPLITFLASRLWCFRNGEGRSTTQ